MKRLIILLIAATLSACGTTAKITHTWMAEDIKEKDLKGVIVLAISDKPDARQRFERRFTDALKKRGVNAVASYELNASTRITKDDIRAMLEESGLQMATFGATN